MARIIEEQDRNLIAIIHGKDLEEQDRNLIAIIHGKDLEEQDRNLIAFKEHCRDNGIKLNIGKLQLRVSEVTLMGHRITHDGFQSDPEKVKAIAKMAAPTNVEELRRYLGMVHYLAKFMPHMTDVIYKLRNLTKHDVT